MPSFTTQRLTHRSRLGAGLLVGATMAGLAAATVAGAGSANASCVSFSGMGNTSQCKTTNLGDVAVVIGNGAATAQGGANVAWAIGDQAYAEAAGKFNLAFANGNPGPNSGMVITPGADGLQIPAQDREATAAVAVGFGNRALAIGDGATAGAVGGDGSALISKLPNRRLQIGNNTAVSVGKGSNSYAGSLPPKFPPGNAPKNQFAGALGDHKNALNGINNK
jgi:hypothetical protein